MKSQPVDNPKLRVLVVDDNVPSAKTMGWIIELLGCDVRLAYNGPDAIAVGKDFVPHVVLMDIGLPGMDGYEVCKIMQNEPEFKHTVFAAQTGWAQEEHRKQSSEAGFQCHLVKPVDMKALEELFSSISPAKLAS